MLRHAFFYPRSLPAFALITAVWTFALLPVHEARADVYGHTGSASGADCFVVADEADKALERRDYRKAVAGYTRAIEWVDKTCGGKVTLDDVMLWQNYEGRARASAGLGDVEQAARDIVKMVKKASHRFNDSNYAWARKALDAAIARQPGNASFRGARASIYHSKRDFTSALAERNAQLKSARTRSERAEAYAGRHYTNLALKNPARALDDITKAIELDPKAEYYVRRARHYRESKQPRLVLDDISEAISLEPEVHYYKMRAEIYQELDQPRDAIDDLTKSLAMMTPHWTNYYSYLHDRAALYRKTGQLDKAYKDYSALIKARPRNAKWRSEQVLVLMEQGEDGRAEAEQAVIGRIDAEVL